MACLTNREIWEFHASPLDEAWQKYADIADQMQFKRSTNFNQALADEMPGKSTLMGMLGAVNDAIKAQQQRDAIRAKSRDSLLDAIFAGELSAIGYRELPSQSREPVEIAPDFFDDPEIAWDRGEASAFGKRYNRIRVYDPADLPGNARPRIGRPGLGVEIDAAISALMSLPDGMPSDFCDIPRKEACQRIRQFLGRVEKPGNGLSDINLNKYILKKCGKIRDK